MSIMAKTPSGYKKIGSAYLGERPVDKVYNANGDVVYALQRELTGVPPLLFKGKEQSELLNYRIYGDTVDGESVGDRTANLFDENYPDIAVNAVNDVKYISLSVENGEYTISTNIPLSGFASLFLLSGAVISGASTNDNGVWLEHNQTVTVSDNFITIGYRIYGNADPRDYSVMLNEGSTALPYEPYGYKVPVTVEGKNLFDMKKFAETAHAQNATVNYSENSLIFTSKNLDAYVNEAFSQINPADQFRPSCINVHPLTTYTISMNTPYKCFISWINDSFNPVAAYTTIPPNQPSYTFTTPSNCTKLLIRLGKYVTNIGDTFTISNIMLNEGSTPLPYEPYHAPVTTPIYLPEPIKMVGDEAEYIDYAEQKQHRVRKNLLPNTVTSETISGVTVTVNSDGSVTCNGTANKTIDLHFMPSTFLLPVGKYRLTGAPSGGSLSSYYLRAWYISSGSVVWITDSGDGINFTLTDITAMLSSIVIMPGQVVDNLTFYPMIRKADIEDDTYEPYIENTDLDVTLPALPTIKGTNTMSVDTEVQPSRIDIKGRIKTLT